MARGWESKSIEAQQAEAVEKNATARPKLSPQEVALARDRDVLLLSRKRVVQQLESASDPRHRKLLQEALTDLDGKLRRFSS